jgi:hypothetical protein
MTNQEKVDTVIDLAEQMLTALKAVKRGYEPYPGYINTMVSQAIERAELVKNSDGEGL